MTLATRTPAFNRYIRPACAAPALWRLLVGLVVFVVIYIGFVIGLTELAQATGLVGTTQADYNLNTRTSLIEGLLTFAGGILGVWAAVRLLHRRSFTSLLGPLPAVRRNFIIAAGVVFMIQAVWMLVTSLYFGVVPNQPLNMVLLFLPVGAILLLIQTGAEEFLFRGYIMQQLAARFQSPLVWLVLPSVVFGLIHYDAGTMGDMVWYIIVALTISGLVWADLTRITGNIGAAWGWHFMNNFLLLNFVTLPDSMTGFAWKLTAFSMDDMTPVDVLPDICVSIVIWLILRRILRPTA